MKIFALLTMFIASVAWAYVSDDDQNLLNDHWGPVPRITRLGDVLRNGVLKQVKFTYDFATDGGSILNAVPLAKTAKLPKNSVMLYSVIDVKTAITSTGNTDVGFGCSTWNDIFPSTAKATLSINSLIVGTEDWTAAKMKRNASECSIYAEISNAAAVTAGKIEGVVVFIETP